MADSDLGKRIDKALDSGKRMIDLAEKFMKELEEIKAQIKPKKDKDAGL